MPVKETGHFVAFEGSALGFLPGRLQIKGNAMTSPVETAIRGVVTSGLMGVAGLNRKLRRAKEPNPYLTGIHTPVKKEETFTGLKVTGEIPAALNGLYVRNGPNPLKAPNHATHHWFVGDGMLHGVRLQAGKALWYRNRWVRSSHISEQLGEKRAPGPRNPSGQDSPNTNVIGHAGKILAIVEAGGFPVEVTETLETRAHTDFDGTLGKAFSAHPHLDPETGEMHAICYFGQDPTNVWHTVLGKDGKVRRNEAIQVQDGPSVHDCMITKNYVIVMDLPVTFSMPALIAGDSFPFRWNPKHAARIGLLPREGKGSDIIWCEIEPCYIFHPANAFETDDGKVVMDACVYKRVFDQDNPMGPDASGTPFERLTIDPVAKKVTRKVIDAEAQEFPRPDERLTGKPYRYAYTVALPQPGTPGFLGDTRLFKHDLETGTRQVHDFGKGRMPGEFVFVPAHANSGEDEGWLVGYVLNTSENSTDLVILDARNFSGQAKAVITIPQRIPPGFHGNFIPMD
jgi:8'-apo-carotenoid 13,14-cleaving dioxygenase